MPSAVKLREDYLAKELRVLARRSKNVNQSRRLLSLAAVRDGMDRRAAAKIGGMDRQTLRDWVHRFNATGPEGLIDNWTEGPAPRLSAAQLAEFATIVEAGPDREKDGVVRWRRVDLRRIIAERFGVDFHERYVGKLLKKLGFSHISARPRHPAQDEQIVEAFKKNFPRALKAHLDKLPETTPVEVWFQDEARIGQKNGLVRQWARRGTRPRQPADQRYDNAYLFGAICPARGVGAALALPYADTGMMQLHLDEISHNVAKGAHAVLLLDRAGWHTTSQLNVPENITPIFLPSRAPELNPVENIWQYLRQNWLSNTVFENYDAIIDAACAAWRKLIAQPETITSIGMREWAHVGQSL
ncbi:IS630 family transposase [Methylocapsa sp. D3K7]|uniref:IS630 family transposase n=1 Tax=Methylocapsa sp. D3K7 TaxID=3041435 RepID=UPI00244E7222|nr:IS630 family transposase [Methylocapsa sp. D3K7]WGJ13277.1 IS630 family transposase [Methylocapsa sp. D3K7]WGJ13283.1 IS630 family transposase [Methylocapsa sp. D3K7]WGJ13876.1 IS630 family transposase [Methylocapsa sp. D3K7]WGJ14165.1 IS630 family transposase [Methylocapsa sp. D3K7]WGJ14184.1 IS630 family transposase [Methylocapsa sp. D3K7]